MRLVLTQLIILIRAQNFLKFCEDYRVPNDPMKYQDEKFYWTYQHDVHWPDDYIGPDSMTRWIIEKSDGFTDVGLYKISESVRAYAYLILSSQASARSGIVSNTASALTAQSAFLNNFENIVNRRVDIREDIKHYQDTLSYASSKVNYSMGQNIYMLPSDMNLKIKTGTIGYNNKMLVSDEKFSLGKNEKVNAGLAKPEEETKKDSQKPTIIHKVVMKDLQLLSGGFASGETNYYPQRRKSCFDFSFSLVALPYCLCFDEQKILCTVVHKISCDS